MIRLLACALALTSPSALAAGFTVETPAGIDLAQGAEAPLTAADVQLGQGVLRSPLGARVEGRTTPALPVVPIEVGAAYLVPSATGKVFRLTVLSAVGRKLVVEVTRAEDRVVPNAALRGRYHLSQLTIDGEKAEPSLPELLLSENQRYNLGGASGTVEQSPRLLALSGYYRAWGPAEICEHGDVLIFRFRRAENELEAVLTRVPQPEPLAQK